MNADLTKLTNRLKHSIEKKAPFVKSIRYPELLVSSLQELNTDVIGNDKVKKSVADQIAHLIMMKQRTLEHPSVKEDEVMLNTVLYGPPGTAKTTLGTKLAKIWYSLGYLEGSPSTYEDTSKPANVAPELPVSSKGEQDLAIGLIIMFVILFITVLSMTWSFYSRFGGKATAIMVAIIVLFILVVSYIISVSVKPKDKTNKSSKNSKSQINTDSKDKKVNRLFLPRDDQIIKIVTRADFVDKYVGWSDKKTLKLLNESLGKVLFVDEAYSLVTDMHDTFGIEILTTINLFLSQHPNEIIIIFAGYKDLMETGIFAIQPGLKRRFMWQFDCSGYTSDQLFDIFKLQLKHKGWGLTNEAETREIFQAHPNAFPAYGGDTQRLSFLSKLEHSHDYIDHPEGMVINKLNPEHVRRGLAKLTENNIFSSNSEENPLANMMSLIRNKKSSTNEDLLNKLLSSHTVSH